MKITKTRLKRYHKLRMRYHKKSKNEYTLPMYNGEYIATFGNQHFPEAIIKYKFIPLRSSQKDYGMDLTFIRSRTRGKGIASKFLKQFIEEKQKEGNIRCIFYSTMSIEGKRFLDKMKSYFESKNIEIN